MQYKFTFYFNAENEQEAIDITDDMIGVYCGGEVNDADGFCECVRSDWVAVGPYEDDPFDDEDLPLP